MGGWSDKWDGGQGAWRDAWIVGNVEAAEDGKMRGGMDKGMDGG